MTKVFPYDGRGLEQAMAFAKANAKDQWDKALSAVRVVWWMYHTRKWRPKAEGKFVIFHDGFVRVHFDFDNGSHVVCNIDYSHSVRYESVERGLNHWLCVSKEHMTDVAKHLVSAEEHMTKAAKHLVSAEEHRNGMKGVGQ